MKCSASFLVNGITDVEPATVTVCFLRLNTFWMNTHQTLKATSVREKQFPLVWAYNLFLR